MPPDDFDFADLKAALDRAAPRPDPATRAAHLRLARETFDRLHQGSAPPARLTSSRHWGGLRGAGEMLRSLTTRGGLTATTALVACGVLLVTPAGQDLWRRGPSVPGEATLEAGPPAEVAEAPADAAPDPAASATSQAAEAGPPPQPDVGASALPQDAGDMETAALPAPVIASEPVARSRVAAPEPSLLQAPAPEAMGAADAIFGERLVASPPPDTEAFANADDDPLRVTEEAPVSTFSIDVDTASYAVVRRSLADGALPPADAVRVEEMINYFPYDHPAPAAGEGPFRPSVSVMPTPWNPDTRLVTIAIQGERPATEDRPPLNLVFLIDTSGSMDEPSKLPLLRQSFRLLVDQLRPEDQVAIVTYAGSAGLVLPPTPAGERPAILAALDGLAAGGSTNGQGGLEQAYDVAGGMAAPGEVTRVILATDGDFNVGLSDPAALEDLVARRREGGAYLSVLGFGRGNLDDATMQALAQNGNGQAAYIDTLSEAQKVLVDQVAGALFPIAQDVKVQVEWNPATVAEYRLIGYETRALRREDFADDRVDAGELGAGHSVTAIYEVTPVGSPARLTDPLRYEAADAEAPAPSAPAAAPEGVEDELGFLRLRWKAPGGTESTLLETPITGAEPAGPESRFAAAVAGWGQLLRGSRFVGDWGYDEAIALAQGNRGDDPFGYRTEAVQLMRLSQSLSE